MREKKTWKKSIPQDQIMQNMEIANTENHKRQKLSKIADADLFSINVDKTGLKKKREKLKADRFKQKEK